MGILTPTVGEKRRSRKIKKKTYINLYSSFWFRYFNAIKFLALSLGIFYSIILFYYYFCIVQGIEKDDPSKKLRTEYFTVKKNKTKKTTTNKFESVFYQTLRFRCYQIQSTRAEAFYLFIYLF